MSKALIPAPFDWPAMMPMLAVFVTGVVAMCIEMIWPRRNNNAIVWTCLLGLGAATFLLVRIWGSTAVSLNGLFVNDRFGQVVQLGLIVVMIVTVMYSEGYLRERRLPYGEYYPLVLWSAVGGMIMATSRDLLIIFLGLEVLSIALYVLAGLSSKEGRSQESALKYFLLGAFASGFLLFGIALIYGATGSTSIDSLAALARLGGHTDPVNYKLIYGGLGMLFVGFGFKVALVPFHQWTPDVYQGAPTSITGFMAAGVKLAAFAALARLLDGAIDYKAIWLPILSALAVITMTVGNLVALVQRDVKRIFGYSSIAHAGYILVGLIAYGSLKGTENEVGFNTIAYYLLAYAVMTVGAFAVVSLTARNGKEGTLIDDMVGMWQSAPFPATMMIIFLASFAGIPPLAGFFGKAFIFMDALNAGLVWLAIALAINSVISAFYYLKIVLAIAVQKPDLHPTSFAKPNVGTIAACAACGLALIGMAVGYAPMSKWFGLGKPTAPLQASN